MNHSDNTWGALILETVRTPEIAANRIMSWQLPRVAVYQILIVVSALNTLTTAFQVSLSVDPGPMGQALSHPFGFFILGAGLTVVFVHLLYWVGNALGGDGNFGDLLTLLIWLEVLRFLAQVVILAAGFVIPALALLLFLGILVLNLWLLLHFIRIAMRLNSMWHATGVLVATIGGLVMGMTVLLSLIGLSTLGISANV